MVKIQFRKLCGWTQRTASRSRLVSSAAPRDSFSLLLPWQVWGDTFPAKSGRRPCGSHPAQMEGGSRPPPPPLPAPRYKNHRVQLMKIALVLRARSPGSSQPRTVAGGKCLAPGFPAPPSRCSAKFLSREGGGCQRAEGSPFFRINF